MFEFRLDPHIHIHGPPNVDATLTPLETAKRIGDTASDALTSAVRRYRQGSRL